MTQRSSTACVRAPPSAASITGRRRAARPRAGFEPAADVSAIREGKNREVRNVLGDLGLTVTRTRSAGRSDCSSAANWLKVKSRRWAPAFCASSSASGWWRSPRRIFRSRPLCRAASPPRSAASPGKDRLLGRATFLARARRGAGEPFKWSAPRQTSCREATILRAGELSMERARYAQRPQGPPLHRRAPWPGKAARTGAGAGPLAAGQIPARRGKASRGLESIAPPGPRPSRPRNEQRSEQRNAPRNEQRNRPRNGPRDGPRSGPRKRTKKQIKR